VVFDGRQILPLFCHTGTIREDGRMADWTPTEPFDTEAEARAATSWAPSARWTKSGATTPRRHAVSEPGFWAVTVTVPDAVLRPRNYIVPAEAISEAGRHLRTERMTRVAQVHTHGNDWVEHSPPTMNGRTASAKVPSRSSCRFTARHGRR
jgi:hypothetical protein